MTKPREMTLPPEVVADILTTRRVPEFNHVFRVYLSALVRAGWRQSCLADMLGLSRARVYQLIINEDYVEQSVEEYRLITGLLLLIPDPPVHPSTKKIREKNARNPHPETMQKLLELQEAAKRYRGVQANRSAAQMFTALVWYSHIYEGASIYAITKALNLSGAALQTRLVRYGYKESSGKSSSYRRLTGRVGREEAEFCNRGHSLNGDNLRILRTDGSRICKTCDAMRHKKYRARKKANLLGGER